MIHRRRQRTPRRNNRQRNRTPFFPQSDPRGNNGRKGVRGIVASMGFPVYVVTRGLRRVHRRQRTKILNHNPKHTRLNNNMRTIISLHSLSHHYPRTRLIGIHHRELLRGGMSHRHRHRTPRGRTTQNRGTLHHTNTTPTKHHSPSTTHRARGVRRPHNKMRGTHRYNRYRRHSSNKRYHR